MNDIQEAIKSGLWPESKKITTEKGIPELENLGYSLFYIGKNADLYFIPGKVPRVLMVRTDRCSVFDILLDLQIMGKGVIQNQISNFGFDFAENIGIKTARCEMLDNIPEIVARRSQVIELCKPLEIELANGEKTGLELIYRNHITGSLFEAYKESKDPYGLNLPEGLQEWDKFETPLFTPTTKGIKDVPLKSEFVKTAYPDIVQNLNDLFVQFTKYAFKKGIVVIDTKKEVFINSKGEWVLGDEVLTPESSRFIAIEHFKNGTYKSMDKQLLRDFGKAAKWKEAARELKPGEKVIPFIATVSKTCIQVDVGLN